MRGKSGTSMKDSSQRSNTCPPCRKHHRPGEIQGEKTSRQIAVSLTIPVISTSAPVNGRRRVTMKTRLNFWCGVAASGRLAVVAAIMFVCHGLSGIPMAAAAQNLTNDSFALTEVAKCKDVCPAITLSSFGDISWGDANGSARSANFQDHFGISASGSANDTENPGGGGGWAYGAFGTSLLIPP